MPRTVKLEEHLTAEELRARYRGAKDPAERSHAQIVWLIARGESAKRAAEISGYSPRWVSEVVRRYNEGGPEALGDRRRENPGGGSSCSTRPSAGSWRRPWRGRPPTAGCGRDRRSPSGSSSGPRRGDPPAAGLGLPQAPRLLPEEPQAPPPRGRPRRAGGLQKNFAAEVGAIREAHPGAEVEAWAQDEHRLGLKPVLRRVWSRRGERPVAPVHHRYEWLYVYGFVRPATGQTFWLVLPRVNKELFSLALSEFAEWVGAGKDKRVVLAVDRAGWHTSEDVALPEGLHLLKLPSHSPELMPAERLWPLVDEPVANRRLEDLDELEGVLVERCRGILARPEAVRSRTRFHWWREAAC